LNFKCVFLITLLHLDQTDRHTSVDAFRRGDKDVLVATDVASKGLDFENVNHVINFDMPEDIEK
jgi:ATP-dependent RNA helicase DDX41